MSELATVSAEATSSLAAIAPPLALIADVDPQSHARRAHQLKGRGFRVAIARTVFETIVKASCLLPDLILLDSSLGDSGVNETAELLSTCPATAHIPIVRLAPGRRLPRQLVMAIARSSRGQVCVQT